MAAMWRLALGSLRPRPMTVRSAVAMRRGVSPSLAGAAVRAEDRRADRRLELEAAAAAVVRGVLGGDRGAVAALGEQVLPGRVGSRRGGRGGRLGRGRALDDVRPAGGRGATVCGA